MSIPSAGAVVVVVVVVAVVSLMFVSSSLVVAVGLTRSSVGGGTTGAALSDGSVDAVSPLVVPFSALAGGTSTDGAGAGAPLIGSGLAFRLFDVPLKFD